MTTTAVTVSPERRSALADKGKLLYGKFCGTGGRGICAESFAVYHISRGELIVAEDLIGFLEATAIGLDEDDPLGRAAATLGLAERVRKHLDALALPTAGEALREFVLESAADAEACG